MFEQTCITADLKAGFCLDCAEARLGYSNHDRECRMPGCLKAKEVEEFNRLLSYGTAGMVGQPVVDWYVLGEFLTYLQDSFDDPQGLNDVPF